VPEPHLDLRERLRLAIRVISAYTRVRILLVRRPLPEAVELVKRAPSRRPTVHPPHRLRRAVERTLSPVGIRPRCLFSALTLFRLLCEQGAEPELVIGLLHPSPDHRAHAWIELGGRDVGPHGGRGAHLPVARYS
jgi:hypothetical protein